MESILYGGIPINEVNFEEEFDRELAILESKVEELKMRQTCKDVKNKNYPYWVIKIRQANQALEVPMVIQSKSVHSK